MNYLALQKVVQRRSGSRSAEVLLGIKEDLNLAQLEVASSLDYWPELSESTTISLVQGTETYTLPTNLLKVRKLWISTPNDDERPLQEIRYDLFRNTYGTTANDSQAVPFLWYRDEGTSGNIKVFPIPEKAYTLVCDYIELPTDMSADTDEPFFPDTWHHILIDYALACIYESPTLRDYTAASYHWTKWRNNIKLMRSSIGNRTNEVLRLDYGTGVNE